MNREMSTSEIVLFVSTVVLAVTLMFTINVIRKYENTIESKNDHLNFYQSTYKKEAGGTALYNGKYMDYDLRSLDGGVTWYAVKRSGDSLKIMGEAEKIYPGLRKMNETWTKLFAKIEKEGPLGSKPLDDEAKLLIKNLNESTRENGIKIK